MSAPVTIEAISKTFPGRGAAPVLDEVSLTAPAGKITTVLGESGCGKTTLLRIVAGLEETTSGRIAIGERDVTAVPAAKRRVAMVFQNYGLYPAKTVARNIEFPLRMARVPARERRDRCLAVARLMHIDHLLDRVPAQLSGGQRQRVGICRALVRNPEILLMDEPLSSLDAQLRIEMRAELMSLQRRIGSTMMYVTHDQAEAMSMSDVLVVLRAGRIEQLGTPLEVFTKPATSYVATFLGNMNLVPPGMQAGVVHRPPPAAPSVTIGVRPEHLAVVPDAQSTPAGLVVEGRVVLTELLGTDRIVHVRAGDHIWRARVDATQPLSERVSLASAAQNVHYFDPESGRRHAA